MSKTDFFCTGFGVVSCVLLYFVMRLRIHIHITYTSRDREPRRQTYKRRTGEDRPHQFPNECVNSPRAAGAQSSVAPADSVVWGDVSSALSNLGVSKPRAREIAKKVCQPGKSMDDCLRDALKEAA